MFIYSLKCHNLKKKLIIGVALVAVVAGGITIGMHKSEPTGLEVSENVKVELKVPDNTSRLTFLKAYGWELNTEPAEVVDVAIPKEFGDVYQNYNEIQKLQGFDLTKFQGKQVKRYTYVVMNYPGESENIRANLLVYKEKVIGGDVCSLEAEGGFMHGFSYQKADE